MADMSEGLIKTLVCLQAKQMWNQLSSEQKKTYGEDYYEAAMTSVEKYSRQVSA